MDLELFEEVDHGPGLASEMGKAFAIGAVTAAGTMVGMLGAALRAGWISEKLSKRRKTKEVETTESE